MCGITAIFNIHSSAADLRQQALKMSKRIRHRGPDWSGIYQGKTAILAHERLSIPKDTRKRHRPVCGVVLSPFSHSALTL